MKTEITVTMIQSFRYDKYLAHVGDEFPEMIAIGYDEINARDAAIRDLRYSCQSDFTNPHTIKDGFGCMFGQARALELDEGEEAFDVSIDAEELTFKGIRYAVYADWIEDADEIISSDLRAEEIKEKEAENEGDENA